MPQLYAGYTIDSTGLLGTRSLTMTFAYAPQDSMLIEATKLPFEPYIGPPGQGKGATLKAAMAPGTRLLAVAATVKYPVDWGGGVIADNEVGCRST